MSVGVVAEPFVSNLQTIVREVWTRDLTRNQHGVVIDVIPGGDDAPPWLYVRDAVEWPANAKASAHALDCTDVIYSIARFSRSLDTQIHDACVRHAWL